MRALTGRGSLMRMSLAGRLKGRLSSIRRLRPRPQRHGLRVRWRRRRRSHGGRRLRSSGLRRRNRLLHKGRTGVLRENGCHTRKLRVRRRRRDVCRLGNVVPRVGRRSRVNGIRVPSGTRCRHERRGRHGGGSRLRQTVAGTRHGGGVLRLGKGGAGIERRRGRRSRVDKGGRAG